MVVVQRIVVHWTSCTILGMGLLRTGMYCQIQQPHSTTKAKVHHAAAEIIKHTMQKETFLLLCVLASFRCMHVSTTTPFQCCGAGPHIALDGDLLSQFLYLPTALQKQLLSALRVQLVLQQAAAPSQAGPPVSVSLPNIIQVLESTLPMC